MNKLKKFIKANLKIEKTLVLIFCVLIVSCVFYVLNFSYKPNQNALGALASVSMDVICIIILTVLVINLTFEKSGINRTTGLFLTLMCGTLYGLFFDFLTWSSDGKLAYGERTYVYTIASLCGGALMAGVFVLYLSSYLDEMYGMKKGLKIGRICFICNMVDFVVTITLGITNKAFIFVDGHYETGTLYDLITIIPIITLIVMSTYAVIHYKTIGTHDVVAVTGYIFIMIAGTLIESIYVVGTTYVGVTVADIFIFVMLQNKMLDRARTQKEKLTEEITSQYEVLSSMAGIYAYVNIVDLGEKTAKRFASDDSVTDQLDLDNDPHSTLNKILFDGIDDEQKDKFWEYTDLSTLALRMKGEKIISAEFRHKEDGWFRAHYIRIGNIGDVDDLKVIYTIRNIDEEKKNVEKWIKKSNTDELTGFFNRHAYEDEIAVLEDGSIKENFVYVSFDVNSLKLANDTLGHNAGDELIVGASDCIRQCFGAYGKLFRTGGDEFVALIFADEKQLSEIKKDIEDVTENWRGAINQELTMSLGFVSGKEAEEENLTIHQIAVLADKRMYEAKTKYYQKRGIDRRGQRDAHVALCALYTKILKINISDDTYQIINMNDEEKTKEKGFSDKISTWLSDFGTSGQVHPEDLERYLAQTDLNYISNHFKTKKSSLSIFYRRKHNDTYKEVMMEIIPANDYSDETQTFFLYVK